jgi:transposase
MDAELAALPDDVDALKAVLLAARADVARVTAEAAAALAEKSSNLALIAHLKLQIEKLCAATIWMVEGGDQDGDCRG